MSEFEFRREDALSSRKMRIRMFDGYTDDWADFVFKNRNSAVSTCEFDFVYGPIADDRVGLQIRKLKDGLIDRGEFLRRLVFLKGITYQYFSAQSYHFPF